MIITLSEPRVSDLVRQLEGINDSTDEIVYRMEHYSKRLFKHVYDAYQLKFVGLVSNQGTIGEFQFAIQTRDLELIQQGLVFLNALSVSIEPQDMTALCDSLVGATMAAHWNEYAHSLQRILPNEFGSAIERACLLAWQSPAAPINEQTFQGALKDAGLKDPLEQHRKQQAFDEAEKAAFKKQEDDAFRARWGIERDE